jgi:hypothetical protein
MLSIKLPSPPVPPVPPHCGAHSEHKKLQYLRRKAYWPARFMRTDTMVSAAVGTPLAPHPTPPHDQPTLTSQGGTVISWDSTATRAAHRITRDKANIAARARVLAMR